MGKLMRKVNGKLNWKSKALLLRLMYLASILKLTKLVWKQIRLRAISDGVLHDKRSGNKV